MTCMGMLENHATIESTPPGVGRLDLGIRLTASAKFRIITIIIIIIITPRNSADGVGQIPDYNYYYYYYYYTSEFG